MKDERTVPLVGIFVGGQARRMNGVAKGLLFAPDSGEVLVLRLRRLVVEACPPATVVLVGQHAAYSHLGLPTLADDPPGIGPLGGLRSLLRRAAREGTCGLALACDLPYVTAPLIARLCEHAPGAPVVAPRVDERWQPFFARYDPIRVLPWLDAAVARGQHALWGLFEQAGEAAEVLPMHAGEAAALSDWDEPGDVRG